MTRSHQIETNPQQTRNQGLNNPVYFSSLLVCILVLCFIINGNFEFVSLVKDQ